MGYFLIMGKREGGRREKYIETDKIPIQKRRYKTTEGDNGIGESPHHHQRRWENITQKF